MVLHLWQNFEWCGILCITPRRKHDICMVLTKSHFTFHAIFRLFLLKYMSQSNIYGVYWTLGHLTGCVFWCCDTLACSYSHSIGSVISASRSMLEFYTLIKHLVLCCSYRIQPANHANTHRLTFKTGVKYSATPKAVPFTEFMTFCMLEEASPRQMNSRRASNELYLTNTAYRVCLENV